MIISKLRRVPIVSSILNAVGSAIFGSPKVLGVQPEFYYLQSDRRFPNPKQDTWQRMQGRVFQNRLRRALIIRAFWASVILFPVALFALPIVVDFGDIGAKTKGYLPMIERFLGGVGITMPSALQASNPQIDAGKRQIDQAMADPNYATNGDKAKAVALVTEIATQGQAGHTLKEMRATSLAIHVYARNQLKNIGIDNSHADMLFIEASQRLDAQRKGGN